MLEFSKKILSKVSFDRQLFKKELRKSIKRLKGEELRQLRDWCIHQFQDRYGDLIQQSFQGLAVV